MLLSKNSNKIEKCDNCEKIISSNDRAIRWRQPFYPNIFCSEKCEDEMIKKIDGIMLTLNSEENKKIINNIKKASLNKKSSSIEGPGYWITSDNKIIILGENESHISWIKNHINIIKKYIPSSDNNYDLKSVLVNLFKDGWVRIRVEFDETDMSKLISNVSALNLSILKTIPENVKKLIASSKEIKFLDMINGGEKIIPKDEMNKTLGIQISSIKKYIKFSKRSSLNKIAYSLYLDDKRNPQTEKDWVIARSFNEAKEIVNTHGVPNYISFDHDLDEDGTGYDFAKWLVEQDLDGKINLDNNFRYNIHSANPIGAKNIDTLLRTYLKSKEIQ
jgi:hypothetical protein